MAGSRAGSIGGSAKIPVAGDRARSWVLPVDRRVRAGDEKIAYRRSALARWREMIDGVLKEHARKT